MNTASRRSRLLAALVVKPTWRPLARPRGFESHPHLKDDTRAFARVSSFLTVGVGFEPTVTTSATPVFKTGPFNRSGTPPGASVLCARFSWSFYVTVVLQVFPTGSVIDQAAALWRLARWRTRTGLTRFGSGERSVGWRQMDSVTRQGDKAFRHSSASKGIPSLALRSMRGIRTGLKSLRCQAAIGAGV